MASRARPFYNVDAAVGRALANSGDDVLLVRLLLRDLGRKGHPAVRFQSPTLDLPLMESFDDNLEQWIIEFQKALRQAGAPVAADGTVTPAPDMQSDRAAVTGIRYTITGLNALYELAHPAQYMKLWEHADAPPRLRQALEKNVR